MGRYKVRKFGICLLICLLPVAAVAGKRPRKAIAKKPVLEAVVQDTLADSEGDEPLSLDELEVENVGVPQWLQTQIVGDTLFIACDQAMLPRRLVVVANDGECLYKLLPQEMAAIPALSQSVQTETTLITTTPASAAALAASRRPSGSTGSNRMAS